MTFSDEIVVDSSALMAVVLDEPEALRLAKAMAVSRCQMSVATWVEVGIVADSRGAIPGARLDEIVGLFAIEQVPVTQHHAQIARMAYLRHGKGSGSPAKLNLGDCFSYALAVTEGRPLLFVGSDFTHTDIVPAHY